MYSNSNTINNEENDSIYRLFPLKDKLLQYTNEELLQIINFIGDVQKFSQTTKNKSGPENLIASDSSSVLSADTSFSSLYELDKVRKELDEERKTREDIINTVLREKNKERDDFISFLKASVEQAKEDRKTFEKNYEENLSLQLKDKIETISRLSNENTKLKNEYADMIKMTSDNSAIKGDGFENVLFEQLEKTFKEYGGDTFHCSLVRSSSGTGDIVVENKETNLRVMIEAKHYDNTVSGSEIKKFKRDLVDPKNNYIGGIFVATCAISNLRPYQTEALSGKRAVYIPHYDLVNIKQIRGYILEFMSRARGDDNDERLPVNEEKEFRLVSYNNAISTYKMLKSHSEKMLESIEKMDNEFKERFNMTLREYSENVKVVKTTKSSTSYEDVKPILEKLVVLDEKGIINITALRDHILTTNQGFTKVGVTMSIRTYLEEIGLTMPKGRTTRVKGARFTVS